MPILSKEDREELLNEIFDRTKENRNDKDQLIDRIFESEKDNRKK